MYAFTKRYVIQLQKVAFEKYIFFKQPHRPSFSYLLQKKTTWNIPHRFFFVSVMKNPCLA
jgi:hypothetical protein